MNFFCTPKKEDKPAANPPHTHTNSPYRGSYWLDCGGRGVALASIAQSCEEWLLYLYLVVLLMWKVIYTLSVLWCLYIPLIFLCIWTQEKNDKFVSTWQRPIPPIKREESNIGRAKIPTKTNETNILYVECTDKFGKWATLPEPAGMAVVVGNQQLQQGT